jgi:chemotaxis protein MotB
MKGLRISLVLLVMVVVAAGCAKKGLIAQKDQQISDLNAKVQSLEDEIARLESKSEDEQSVNKEMEHALADLREKQEVWIDEREGLIHITLNGAANFPTASADLTKEAKRVIDRLGGVLQKYPDRWILIEGNADERPIAKDLRWKYPSNWELSTARANAVLHYLLDNFHLDPDRVQAVGLGKYHPVDDHSSPEAWAKNRRVVITVGSKLNVEKRMASQGS